MSPWKQGSSTPTERIPFSKTAFTLDEQVSLLRSRGLTVPDEIEAKKYLKFIGYYRFSGYCLPFQDSQQRQNHQFLPGTTFEQVLDCSIFDRKLRVLVIDAIERIEVAIRALISDTMSLKYGPHWYLEPQSFDSRLFEHGRFLLDVEEHVRKNNALTFIRHYQSKYTPEKYPPSWMVFEVLPFGTVSFLYKNLKEQKDRKAISQNFGLQPFILESWLHSISYLRNLCAHHSRVWNRVFTIKPIIAKQHAELLADNSKFYAQALIIYTLLKAISPDTTWAMALKQLIKEHPGIPIKAMGFPKDWDMQAFWNVS